MTVLLAVGQMEVGDGLGVAWTPDRVIVASAPASVSKGEVYVAVGVVVGEDEDDEDEDEEDVAGDVALFDISLSLSLSLPLSGMAGCLMEFVMSGEVVVRGMVMVVVMGMVGMPDSVRFGRHNKHASSRAARNLHLYAPHSIRKESICHFLSPGLSPSVPCSFQI